MSEVLDVYLQIGTHDVHHLGTVPAVDNDEHVSPHQLAALLHASAHKILEVTSEQAGHIRSHIRSHV